MSETVWLDHWNHPVYGERWSVVRGDRTSLLTYASEEQARAAVRRFGWTLADEVDDAFGRGAQ